MPRKGPAPKRPLVVDPVYQSPLVTSLVNKILLDGKKSIAETIVYGALEGCREKTGTDPVQTLKRALDNIKPTLEVKSRRVGGATYQVPVEVKPNRATTLSLRWLATVEVGGDPVDHTAGGHTHSDGLGLVVVVSGHTASRSVGAAAAKIAPDEVLVTVATSRPPDGGKGFSVDGTSLQRLSTTWNQLVHGRSAS